jgi:hypothetical protein
MRRELFFAISGVAGTLFGLGFLLLPEMSLQTYGVPTGPHNVMQSRYFGSALLAIGLVSWLARETQDAIAIRAILVAGIASNAAGAVISAAAAGSLQNGLAWMSVGIYGVFSAWGAWLLMATRKPAPVAPA